MATFNGRPTSSAAAHGFYPHGRPEGFTDAEWEAAHAADRRRRVRLTGQTERGYTYGQDAAVCQRGFAVNCGLPPLHEGDCKSVANGN